MLGAPQPGSLRVPDFRCRQLDYYHGFQENTILKMILHFGAFNCSNMTFDHGIFHFSHLYICHVATICRHLDLERTERLAWNFYFFSLNDVQGFSMFAARQASYAAFSTQGDFRLKRNYLKWVSHRLFVPFFAIFFGLFFLSPGNISTF